MGSCVQRSFHVWSELRTGVRTPWHASWLEAAQLELSLAGDHPDRHPCGGTTTFVRFLNAYAIEVERSRSCRLVDDVDDDVYYDFAHRIARLAHGRVSSSDDDDPPTPPGH